MQVSEFIIKLGQRFTPITQADATTLQFQIESFFKNITNQAMAKLEENKKIENKVNNLNFELESNVSDDQKKQIADNIKQLNESKAVLTVKEKACLFFEKPIVKIGLVLAFALISKIIVNRLANKGKDNVDDEQDNQPQHNGYNPYGYYYPYPPGPHNNYAPHNNYQDQKHQRG